MISCPVEDVLPVAFLPAQGKTLQSVMDVLGFVTPHLNDFFMPLQMSAELTIPPPLQELPRHLAPWDALLDSQRRFLIYVHPVVHEQCKDRLQLEPIPLKLCPPRCPAGEYHIELITFAAMPFCTLLWSHYGQYNRIRELQNEADALRRDVDELQGILGRVIETICAWDAEMAGGFQLLRGQRSLSLCDKGEGVQAVLDRAAQVVVEMGAQQLLLRMRPTEAMDQPTMVLVARTMAAKFGGGHLSALGQSAWFLDPGLSQQLCPRLYMA